MGISLTRSNKPLHRISNEAEENDIVVIPTKRGIREFLALSKNKTTPSPTITTQEAFFDSLVATNGYAKADKLIKMAYLKQSLETLRFERLLKNADPDQIKSLEQFKAFADYLLAFFKELMENRVDFDCLKKEALYTDYELQVEALKELLSRYEQSLKSKNLIDINLLKQKLKIKKPKKRKIHILLCGILTTYEMDALKELSKENEIKIYASSTVRLPELTERFLAEIDKNQSQQIKEKLVNPLLYKTGSNMEMADWVVEMVHKEHVENGTPLNEITVVLPDESLIKRLKLIERELFNFAGGFPLSESIYMRFLKLTLEAIGQKTKKGFPGTYMIKLRAHPFIKVKGVDGYKPIYNKQIGGAFECIEKIANSEEISLQKCASALLKCFRNINYESHHYDFISATKTLFDELERLSLLNRKLVNLKASGAEMLRFIYEWISSIRYPDAGIGEVSVIGMLESRVIDSRVIIMPSVNEDTLPEPSKKELFLNTYIRKACGLPTYADRENLQRYYFKNILSSAQRVYIGYVESEEKTASRFLTEFLQKNEPSLYTSLPIRLFDTDKTKEIATITEVKEAIERNDEIDNKISSMKLSAHSLTDFKECPYRFYLRYVKGISSEKGFKDDSTYEVGNIVHRIMEELYREGKPIQDKEILRNRLRELFDRMVQESDLCSVNPLEHLKLQYMLYRIEHSNLLDYESRCKATLIEHERAFRIEMEGKTIEGKIDRINIYPDGFEIVDYKTGNVEEIKTTAKPYNVQLPLYAIAMKRELKKECKGVAYLSFRQMKYIKMEEITNRLNEFEEDIKRTIIEIKETEIFKKNRRYCAFCPFKEICRT